MERAGQSEKDGTEKAEVNDSARDGDSVYV